LDSASTAVTEVLPSFISVDVVDCMVAVGRGVGARVAGAGAGAGGVQAMTEESHEGGMENGDELCQTAWTCGKETFVEVGDVGDTRGCRTGAEQ
jgi:hypothetical protein